MTDIPPPLSDPALNGKFWLCHHETQRHMGEFLILSSEEAARLLGEGTPLTIVSGPHDTREAAQYDLDVRWESPGEE